MAYVLEQMTPADEAKVLSDADSDERKKRFLLTRGGFFENYPGQIWAVDREHDSYLFWGPKREPMIPDYYYTFYFKKVLYTLRVPSPATSVVYFEDAPVFAAALATEVKAQIRAAFAVYGVHGQGKDRSFSPVFADEA
jgi:hypothetical protein